MKLIYVFYHNYFLFYKKVLKDPDPLFATTLSFSFSQSLLINGLMDIVALKLFCYQIAVWVQFGIVVALIYGNYLLFHRSGKVSKLVKTKPVLGSKEISVAITIMFFLITVSWLFWGPIFGKHLLNQCN